MTLQRVLMVSVAVLMLASAASSQGNRSPEAHLRAAMDKETVDGDLKAAIDGYKRVISQRGASREVVAQAWLRLGMAQEKQGDAEARKSYDRLVREFGDQPAVVQQARAVLARMPSAAGSTTMRLVCSTECDASDESVSPDGRYLLYRTPAGGFAIREFSSTATIRQIVPAPTTGRLFSGEMSPDGSRIAYEHSGTGIVVVNSDGSGRRTVCSSGNPQTAPSSASRCPQGAPFAWSLDGSRLLIATWNGSGPTAPGRWSWLRASDGSIEPIQAQQHLFFLEARMSPDGRLVAFSASDQNLEREQLRTDVFVMASDGSAETRVSDTSGDGSEGRALFHHTPVGWSPDTRYMFYSQQGDESPLLWKVPIAGGRVDGPAVAVSVPHRGQVDRYLGIVAGTLYYRITVPTTSDIYTASMDPATGRVTSMPVKVSTARNGSNVTPKWSPDGRRILYALARPDQLGPGELRIAALDDRKDDRVPGSVPYGGDGACWSRDGSAILVNALMQGRGNEPTRVDLKTGEFTSVFPGAASFRMRNCSDTLIPALIPDAATRTDVIAVRNLQTGAQREVYRVKRLAAPFGMPRTSVPFGIPNISHDGRFIAFFESLDESTSALMVVPTDGGVARELVRAKAPVELQTLLGIAWSPDDRFVYFVRRSDSRATHELFRVPVTGGTAVSTGLQAVDLRDLDISPDGRRIAFSLGAARHQEIWALDNFLPTEK